MQNQNFTATLLVDQTPEQVYNVINNVQEWWTGEPGVEGNTRQVGEEFTYRFRDIHYSKQKLLELIPDKKIVWLVTESNLNFIKDKSEWTGTQIKFEIFGGNGHRKDNKTEVRFTHEGLTPTIECYKDCSTAWSSYINSSLKKFITNSKETARKPDLA